MGRTIYTSGSAQGHDNVVTVLSRNFCNDWTYAGKLETFLKDSDTVQTQFGQSKYFLGKCQKLWDNKGMPWEKCPDGNSQTKYD